MNANYLQLFLNFKIKSMCKQCEFDPQKGIIMNLNPIGVSIKNDAHRLPRKWQQLIESGFPHEDLILRACAHMVWSERTGDQTVIRNAKAFLSAMARGFLMPFDRSTFEPQATDSYFELKTNALHAIEELSLFFGNRVSSVTWNSLAHLSTRKEPEEKKSILKEASILPHHYGIVDTQLHAIGKVYTFALYMQSVFSKHTGRILVHNCDCDCSLLNLQPVSGAVVFSLGHTQVYEATQSLFTHQLAESHLILNAKLPFEYTITKEAQELLGIQ